ncbi:MAG: ATP-binding protein [Defluviitaleaceae bacterium]|nr:ATP-binding protein [Defluviitaleaceae bacterium]
MLNKLINNMTVKSRIISVLIVVMVVATTLVVWVRVNQVTEQIDLLLEERLKGNANMTFGIFDTVMVYTTWMLDSVATHARLGFADPGYDLEMQLFNMYMSMSQEIDGVRSYENIAVFDANFNLVSIANIDRELPDIDLFSEYLDEQMAGIWVSPVFESDGGRLQFLFSKPVTDGENFLGMVAITGNTEMLAYFLRDFVQAYDSFVNIADRSGVIFFSNRPEAYMGRHVNDLGVIEAFGEIPMNTVFAHNSALTGIDKIAYVTHDPYLNWSIVSFFDAHAVENPNWIIFTGLVPTVSGIILASALIVWIIHKSLKPLEALAVSAQEVSRGNVSVAFQVNRNDEIGQVANAFTEAVRVLNILRSNFKKAENAMTRGDIEYSLEDSRLGGIYDEILSSTGNIVGHMKQSMADAEAASKAKSDFLSKMSHEIRTPMNAIMGMAQLILREDISGAVREQAVTIKQSGDHLLSIINDILDLSKVESGKMELANDNYLFHSTIHDVISIIKMRMQNPNVKFAAYMQHDIPNEMFGDEVRVRQVLLNVLTNAVKYTKKGHFSLEILGESAGDTIMLTMKIKDTGIGLKPEDLEKLFGEFTQFDLEKNRNIEGTGLGLAITHSLIKLMGGEVDVTSVYGEGSEFTIRLPQRLGEKKEISDYGAWPPHFESERVLLYGSTQIYMEYAARTLADLQTEFHIITDDGDLYTRLIENKWAYIFAEEDFAATAQHIVTTRGLRAKVVVMSDSYETKGNLPVLIMPAYLISIANVLSGRDAMYSLDNQQQEYFTAPDAKVLLVDDIETNLKVGQGLLKPYGMTIKTCLSGKEAVEAVVAGEYDLVLMDHMMPEMDGVEAVKIIRNLAAGMGARVGEKYAKVPIIALTANAIVGAKEMFLQNGFNDFLSKPIEVSKLNGVLSKWIPKEKQKSADPNQTEDPPEEKLDISIPDVDVTKGIAFSGGSAVSYLDTLSVFRKDGLSKIKELANCLRDSNLTLYTTYVHALKSACANIGAGKISEEAKILEAAGLKEDLEFILGNNENFVSGLKKLLDDIGGVIAANTAKPDTGLSMDALKDGLAKLKTALENFDLGEIDEISETLQSFTTLPDIGEALGEMLQNVFVSRYKQAKLQIEELINAANNSTK